MFTIDDEIRSLFAEGIDDMITQLGRPCVLYYPSVMQNCTNCVLTVDSIGHKSSNRWRSGGPMPFPNGMICPMCQGNAKIASENNDTITMLCYLNGLSSFTQIGLINSPQAILETKGFTTDLPKVMKCANLSLYGVSFILSGTPYDESSLVQGRYFLARWTRG